MKLYSLLINLPNKEIEWKCKTNRVFVELSIAKKKYPKWTSIVLVIRNDS